ncbi:TIGR00645 family protein [Spiractinospora alimapuensis]|uniref:TIGR00645 family protein n=1 Tax=Spiractinospora alimapuensis TaxID=2820884 RepID=UPI001EEAEF48|nr:TIGR00645 family protein [Spiractinospora alimapuensis]QVQ52074.1 TIGR00645 family protein [Spiractinospora alimapuensis]
MPQIASVPGLDRRHLGYVMFVSRWLQAPLYLGLIVAQALYVWVFVQDVWHLVLEAFHGRLDETSVMLIVLGLVDVVMIANLLIMVIIGGYETFVSKVKVRGHPDEPQWLDHINPNILKVKLAMAIVGISSIHLLQTFIEAGEKEPHTLFWQTMIHLTFVASALALAVIDRILLPPPAPARDQDGAAADPETPDRVSMQ